MLAWGREETGIGGTEASPRVPGPGSVVTPSAADPGLSEPGPAAVSA